MRNTAERIVVLGAMVCTPEDKVTGVHYNVHGISSPQGLDFIPLEELEKNYIKKVLKSCNWQISGDNGAAKILKLNPSTLRFRIKKLSIAR